jgi:hypothetical protein
MHTLSANNKRWRISKGRNTVLEGIGTAQQAVALARLHSIVLTHFYDLPKLESVA